MSEQVSSPRAEEIFGMMDSAGTGTINLAAFKKAFPQLMQQFSPQKITAGVPAPRDEPLYPSLPDNSAEDIFASAFNDIESDSISLYFPGQGVSFDDEAKTNHRRGDPPLDAERKELHSLLGANVSGLPGESAQEQPAETSAPIVVETTRASHPPRVSDNQAVLAAVADIGAREIFAQSFDLDQETQEENLLDVSTDDYLHWAPVSAADLCQQNHSPPSSLRMRTRRKSRRLSGGHNPIFGSPTRIQSPRTDSEIKSLMKQHKAADRKRWEMIDSIRTQVSPNSSSHSVSSFF